MPELSTENLGVADPPVGRFRHEALFYEGPDDFLRGTVPFIRSAIENDEPVLVMVNAPKIGALRDALGPDRDGVEFANIDDVGTNPARIIPAWSQFADSHRSSGRRLRGIGEPIWADRSAAELVEAQHHELLLNVAFTDADLELLCPYDTASLPEPAVDAARHSHPLLIDRPGRGATTGSYDARDVATTVLEGPLPEPAGPTDHFPFDAGLLGDVRAFVAGRAASAGIENGRANEFVLATNEVASNSVRHGGGTGELLAWVDAGTLVCEIRDAGTICDPMLGRVRPTEGQTGGRGLWLAHQVCDLVQLRSSGAGTAVRLHMRAP